MKLTNYVDIIWSISERQTVDVGVSRDMFCTNVLTGAEKYAAKATARKVDYPALKKEWEAIGEVGQRDECNNFQEVTKLHYAELCVAYRAGNTEKMIKLVN